MPLWVVIRVKDNYKWFTYCIGILRRKLASDIHNYDEREGSLTEGNRLQFQYICFYSRIEIWHEREQRHLPAHRFVSPDNWHYLDDMVYFHIGPWQLLGVDSGSTISWPFHWNKIAANMYDTNLEKYMVISKCVDNGKKQYRVTGKCIDNRDNGKNQCM